MKFLLIHVKFDSNMHLEKIETAKAEWVSYKFF